MEVGPEDIIQLSEYTDMVMRGIIAWDRDMLDYSTIRWIIERDYKAKVSVDDCVDHCIEELLQWEFYIDPGVSGYVLIVVYLAGTFYLYRKFYIWMGVWPTDQLF